ncbi:MAG: Nucleoid occlusion protein [Chroococcidiopsis sp. SAG 2025]|uniref:ParB/RepB/Spo0J family partition protein n=1 Tax=Chroococcidiopsis sp. SAG 2025 TaxID=171389 RepID=UPI0029372D5D|nr:ParB N-terminal domain-containing protein [Chroococcidiopsis sp. SAG 2025]MDV2998059.1 Nucleoid occlusion protein [Chroococcidiopsis sp. SAG 2025]
MSKSSKPSVLGMFAGAAGSQQVFELEERIEALQAETTRLKAEQTRSEFAQAESTQLNQTIEELREQLKASGISQVHFNQVKPNPKQARQTFTPDSIHSMAVSIREEGQQEPIILLPGNLIFDGERRWRAVAEYLQPEIDTLDAVMLPKELSEEELHARTLLTSLHRENLNELDLAEGLIQQAKLGLKIEQEEVVKALRRAIARLNAKKLLPRLTQLVSATREEQLEGIEDFDLDETEQNVFLLLLRFQQNPASVDANVFPCLRLSLDLKTAIWKLGLGANHARSLQQLNAKNLAIEETVAEQIRQEAITRVLQERLTIAKTRSLVTKIIAERNPEKKAEPNRQISSLIDDVLATKLDRVQPKQLRNLLSALEAKAREIREKLGNVID